MPRFKQDHPKQVPNLMQNFCVMTSHLPNQLSHFTSQLNEISSSGKQTYLIKRGISFTLRKYKFLSE